METSYGKAMRSLAIARTNWSAISHLGSSFSKSKLAVNFPSTSRSLGYACSQAERAPVALKKAPRQKSQEKQGRPSRCWEHAGTVHHSSNEIRGRLRECDLGTKSISYTWELPMDGSCVFSVPSKGLPKGCTRTGAEQTLRCPTQEVYNTTVKTAPPSKIRSSFLGSIFNI